MEHVVGHHDGCSFGPIVRECNTKHSIHWICVAWQHGPWSINTYPKNTPPERGSDTNKSEPKCHPENARYLWSYFLKHVLLSSVGEGEWGIWQKDELQSSRRVVFNWIRQVYSTCFSVSSPDISKSNLPKLWNLKYPHVWVWVMSPIYCVQQRRKKLRMWNLQS